MTTDDLRKRAREAAEQYAPTGSIGPRMRSGNYVTLGRNIGFESGYLAHAEQQPSREEIANTLNSDGWTCAAHEPIALGKCEGCWRLQTETADHLLQLLDGEEG